MRRLAKWFLITTLIWSFIGGSVSLPVAHAATPGVSFGFEEIDMGWAEDAFTFPNQGAIEKIHKIESSSTNDLFVIAQLPKSYEKDIFHFGTDGTYHGLLIDRDSLAQEVAGASWLAGGTFDFDPEHIVFSAETDGDYLYIIHNQSETIRPMLKFDLQTKSVVDAEFVVFSEAVTSIQKAHDGLLYAAANLQDAYYTIDPEEAAPVIATYTTTWNFPISSIVKTSAGDFMVKKYGFGPNNKVGYVCDVTCNQLEGPFFSAVSASADGMHVAGVTVYNSTGYVYVNGVQAGIDLNYAHSEGAIFDIDNGGTLYLNDAYGYSDEILIYQHDASSNRYIQTASIGSGRETSYTDTNLEIVQDEEGHIFILDYTSRSLKEFDASGMYVRSMSWSLNHQLSNLAYYNGRLYAMDENQNNAVVVISKADLSVQDTLWEYVRGILFTPEGSLFVARTDGVQQYSVDRSTNELTLVHTYPFTGYGLTMHADGKHVTIADGSNGWIRIMDAETYHTTQVEGDYRYTSFWMDPSGLIALLSFWSGVQIVHPDNGVQYSSTESSYGSRPFYIGNRQMLLPKTYYDQVKKEIRTELVGLRITAPNVGGTPVFSSAQDELQILTGTPVTTNTVDLGIDFPMAGTTVRELTIDGSQRTDFYFTDFPLIGFNFNKSRGDVYQAVIGDEVGKRQAILQFNNIHQNWEEGTLQFIFFEETGEIQAQFEKHQPSNGESVDMREIIDWSTTISQGSYLNSGDTMRFLPQRAKFVLNRGGAYIPVVLQSASAPEAPILQTPIFGTEFLADTPEVTFTWDNPNAEEAYSTLFMVATDPTFNNVVARQELTGTESYTMDTSRLLAGIPYYWKVVVADTAERVFSYSANGAFSLVEEQEIDSTPPEVEFNINGRTTAAKTADSTVTVTDTESGVDGDSLRYVWTQSTDIPDSGWESFTSGQILSQSTGDGSWYLHVQASDQAGNRIDAVSNTFVLDNTAPTVSVSSSASNTVNDAFPITITFNESVTGLTEDDLLVVNGTASDFASVDVATYTATITPETSGQDVSVSIAAGAATDTAGNNSTASNTLTKRYDTTKPVLTFGGFTDEETFHTPPAEVSVVVSEAVYWVEDGAELDADNALSLISMTKDGDDFSGYTPTYDESSRTYVLTFNDVLEDGLYDIAVAGDVVANENGNTLDGARASFVVAIPVVTRMSASPISLPSAGGNSTVTMIGDNLTGQTVKVYVDGVEAVTATVDSNTSAWATLSLPANQTYAAKNYSVTVDLNGEAVAGVSSTVEVGAAPSPPPPPTYTLSANADLAELDVYAMNQRLALSPAFTPGTTSYTVQTDTDQVRLQLSADHPYAVVKLAGERVDKSATVPLALGSNKLEITVQAENGTIKTYTVTIERIAGNEPVEPVEPPVTPIPVCSFTDIEGHWAQSELCEAAELGIVEGVDALTFRPDGEVTRAEFTAMLLRTLHIPIDYASQELTFSDKNSVPEWALPTIQTAVEQGIIQGYTDGTLRPQQTVSRTEMTALVARAMAWGTDSLASTPFADDARIPDWAKAYVEAVRVHGLLEGREGNRFVPDGQTTRAEAAVVLLRLWHAIH